MKRLFYFCNSSIFEANTLVKKLQQLKVPPEIRLVNNGFDPNGGIQYYPFYKETFIPDRNENNFRWLCCGNSIDYMPWQDCFRKELKRISPAPQLLFFNGALDNVKRLDNVLLTKVSDLLTYLQSQQIGVIWVAPDHLKSTNLYQIFHNVIEIKPWRSHKCGERCLSLSYVKTAGKISDFPIQARVRSSNQEINWKTTHVQSDELFLKIRFKMEIEGKTARQIVEDFVREGEKMSLPQLAKLKRIWGLKTYKKHQHRKKREILPGSTQQEEISVSDSNKM